jgi:hypothetical protein
MFDAPPDLLYGPAMKAPPGVFPLPLGRTSPDQKWYFICVPLFTIIPGFFLMLRLYTKVNIVRKVDLTDCKNPTIAAVCLVLTISQTS